jgi:hypothetical protein
MPQIGVELVGAHGTMSHLREIAGRARDPEAALRRVFPIFERAEAELFESLGGKYVRTGATRKSLTEPTAKGAVREVHGTEFVFGSKVWYAKFQGTTGPGSHRPPSAILKLTPEMAREASEAVLAYVTAEAREGVRL